MKFPNAQATVYNDTVVRQFAIMTVVWGVVGMLVGVIIAAQLAWPELNLGISFLSYGRLRPLHTNAVIFAFGGCGLFATAYYVVQRTCQVRLFSDKLAAFTFWGWQLVILAAALSLPLGYTQGKEYAELEWPIDILITLVWVSFAVVFFGTVGTRKVRHIYVANWFFGAFIIAVAILHLVNSAWKCRSPAMKSYSACTAGVHGCHGAVVVWPQRSGLPADSGLPWHDVLFRAQAGGSPRLLLPPLHRALLGADLPSISGPVRTTCTIPPCLTGPSRWAW
jgi:cytochrome c oxidase cbb3-type subunit 1